MASVIDPSLEKLYQARSLSELLGAGETIARAWGFSSFGLLARSARENAPAKLRVHSTVDPAYLSRYIANDYASIDPRVSYVLSGRTVPIVWSRELYDTERTQRLFAESAEVGVRGGVLMPVHRPGAETVATTCNIDVELSSSSRREQIQHSMGRVVVFLLVLEERAYELNLAERTRADLPRAVPELSPRERECLLWIAQGKTSHEIAAILGISEATTNFHVGNVLRKLKASNRVQAAAYAVAQGLIKP